MPKLLEVKVCGMKDRANMEALLELPVDYVGMIFYEKSARFAGGLDPTSLNSTGAKKVGVFVNAPIDTVLLRQQEFGLDIIQLHGQEAPSYCRELKDLGIPVWKAFGMADNFDFGQLSEYALWVERFLFDTLTPQHGGSGRAFDWSQLSLYTGKVPYLLSGGIGLHNIHEAMQQHDSRLVGLDLNSKLELAPGLKDIDLVKKVLNIIHHEQVSGR